MAELMTLKENNRAGTVFVTARYGYAVYGIEQSGYKCYNPYKGKGLIARIAREICFRFLSLNAVWFKTDVVSAKPDRIVVQDPLITRKYLLWLQKKLPEAKIVFSYCNMVGKARHLKPADIPNGIDVWTYDQHDAETYGLKLQSSGAYCLAYIGKKQDTEYDVFFVGKDKGRAAFLLDLERKLKDAGLKTKFIITKDGRFSKKKPFYSNEISYKEVVEYDNRSRAILNVVMPGQKGATLRDYEALFNGVKLITTNRYADRFDFYKPENIFILKDDNINELIAFLNVPLSEVDAPIKEHHEFSNYVNELF